jgi:hypothetical protein
VVLVSDSELGCIAVSEYTWHREGKRMHRHARMAGFLLFCWAVAASATPNEPILNISMVAAGQQGPLEIVGFRPTEGDDNVLTLHIRNVSSKATQDFWVEPLVRNPSGQIWHSTNGHAATRPGFGSLAPGTETWDSNSGALRLTLAMVAKDLHSTCLRITPMVMAVDFAGGTSWKANSSDETDAMARADRKSSTPACTDSLDAKNYLEHLDAVGFKGNVFDSYWSEEPSGSQSFSFACSLHRVNDTRVRAVCDNHNPK